MSEIKIKATASALDMCRDHGIDPATVPCPAGELLTQPMVQSYRDSTVYQLSQLKAAAKGVLTAIGQECPPILGRAIQIAIGEPVVPPAPEQAAAAPAEQAAAAAAPAPDQAAAAPAEQAAAAAAPAPDQAAAAPAPAAPAAPAPGLTLVPPANGPKAAKAAKAKKK